MGHKILDDKADIHEDVEAYFNKREQEHRCWSTLAEIREDVLDIVDKHFEKIER